MLSESSRKTTPRLQIGLDYAFRGVKKRIHDLRLGQVTRREKALLILSCIVLCLLVIVLFKYASSSVMLILFSNQKSESSISETCKYQLYIQRRDRKPSDPNIESIFNCHSSFGKCQYFRPTHFFSSCGAGSKYEHLLEDMFQMRTNGDLWKEMPPILLAYLKLDPKYMKPKQEIVGKEFIFDRQNLSFIHVHKCGGSSLVTSVRDADLDLLPISVLPPQYNNSKYYKGSYTLYSPKKNKKRNDDNWLVAKYLANNAVTYRSPSDWNETNHMIVAVVRDPIDRFLSAVGHVSSEKFADYGGDLREQCLKSTTRETMKCFLALIRDGGYWIDLHFTPMVLEMSFATAGQDAPIAVFPFEYLPSIIENVGGNPRRKRKDGKKPGYRPSVLSNLKAEDLDADILYEICKLYEIDVLFLKSLGMSVVHC